MAAHCFTFSAVRQSGLPFDRSISEVGGLLNCPVRLWRLNSVLNRLALKFNKVTNFKLNSAIPEALRSSKGPIALTAPLAEMHTMRGAGRLTKGTIIQCRSLGCLHSEFLCTEIPSKFLRAGKWRTIIVTRERRSQEERLAGMN